MITQLPTHIDTDYPCRPADGSLVVTHSYSIANRDLDHDSETVHRYTVDSVEEAMALIRKLAAAQIDDPNISINVFNLERYYSAEDSLYDDPAWVEWEDEDGMDIMSLLNAEYKTYDKSAKITFNALQADDGDENEDRGRRAGLYGPEYEGELF